MAHIQDHSAPYKTLLASIHPCDRLHITIDLQQELVDQLWLPGMSAFPSKGPPFSVAQSSAKTPEALPGYQLSGCHPVVLESTDLKSPSPAMVGVEPQPIDLIVRRQQIFAQLPPHHQQVLMRQRQLQLRLQEKQEQWQRLRDAVPPQSEHNATQQLSNMPPANLDVGHDPLGAKNRTSILNSQSCDVIDYMRKSGASEETIKTARSNPALLDYNYQLMLLEHQNKNRMIFAKKPCAPLSGNSYCGGATQPVYHGECSQNDYISQLKLLGQEQKKRLALAQGERDIIPKIKTESDHDERRKKREVKYEAPSVSAEDTPYSANNETYIKRETQPSLPLPSLFAPHRSAPQDSNSCAPNAPRVSSDDAEHRSQGPSHQLWLSGPHALQDYETQRRIIEQDKHPQNPAPASLALQDYQMQLMLLEQQNKKRHMIADIEKANTERKLAAQREDIIKRHQVNMKHWQATQQQNVERPYTPETHTCTAGICPYPCQPAQKPSPAAPQYEGGFWVCPYSSSGPSKEAVSSTLPLRQRSAATRNLHCNVGEPQASGPSAERFSMDLPIRPLKKTAEQAELDPDMDDWSNVERPPKRACSEESEQFPDEIDLIEFEFEC
jgi:hypothetical protein